MVRPWFEMALEAHVGPVTTWLVEQPVNVVMAARKRPTGFDAEGKGDVRFTRGELEKSGSQVGAGACKCKVVVRRKKFAHGTASVTSLFFFSFITGERVRSTNERTVMEIKQSRAHRIAYPTRRSVRRLDWSGTSGGRSGGRSGWTRTAGLAFTRDPPE